MLSHATELVISPFHCHVHWEINFLVMPDPWHLQGLININELRFLAGCATNLYCHHITIVSSYVHVVIFYAKMRSFCLILTLYRCIKLVHTIKD